MTSIAFRGLLIQSLFLLWAVYRLNANLKEQGVEIAGYNVMSDLLKLFIPATLKEKASGRDEKILRLIPKQFSVHNATSPYEKAIAVLDYVAA
jgi:dGTP triphosphohydrolase